MKEYQLKILVKAVLKEILQPTNPHPIKLVDHWRDVSTVKYGRMRGTRGYFIMKNGKLADASVEMEGSTGIGGGVDHFGVAVALYNAKYFGIPEELSQAVLKYGDGSEAAMNLEGQDLYMKLWEYIHNAVLARVYTMLETSNTHKPDITIQFFKNVSPKTALMTVQRWIGKQVPDAPENSQVSVDLNQDDYLFANNIREFLSTKNPNDLKEF